MEIPIRIMIVLFVTVAVGAAVLVFSKQMITNSATNLEKIGNKNTDAPEDRIIQLQYVDYVQIGDLMTECFRQNHGKTLTRELCFVIIGKTASWTWPEVEDYFAKNPLKGGNISKGSYVADDDIAMSIYFDPEGLTDTIELTRT